MNEIVRFRLSVHTFRCVTNRRVSTTGIWLKLRIGAFAKLRKATDWIWALKQSEKDGPTTDVQTSKGGGTQQGTKCESWLVQLVRVQSSQQSSNVCFQVFEACFEGSEVRSVFKMQRPHIKLTYSKTGQKLHLTSFVLMWRQSFIILEQLSAADTPRLPLSRHAFEKMREGMHGAACLTCNDNSSVFTENKFLGHKLFCQILGFYGIKSWNVDQIIIF